MSAPAERDLGNTSYARRHDIEVTVGVDGSLRSANPQFLTLTGLSERQLTTLSLLEISHPADLPVTVETLANLTTGRLASLWESRLLDVHDGVHVIRWVGHPPRDGAVVLRGSDITTERPTSARIVADDWLRESMHAAQVGAWRYDITNDIVYADLTFRELMDASSLEAIDTWADLASLIHDDDRLAFLASRDELVRRGRLSGDFRLAGHSSPPRYIAVRLRLSVERQRRRLAVGAAWDVSVTKALEARLTDLAMRDQLTGLPNRRAFTDALEREWGRAVREQTSTGFLMIDVDNFKQINDAYGHPAGDQALADLAQILADCVQRPSDFSARWGGEEFAVLLPDTDASGAAKVATAIIVACRSRRVEPTFTVSVGVASNDVDDMTAWDLLRRADHACLAAKGAGKNQAIQAGPT